MSKRNKNYGWFQETENGVDFHGWFSDIGPSILDCDYELKGDIATYYVKLRGPVMPFKHEVKVPEDDYAMLQVNRNEYDKISIIAKEWFEINCEVAYVNNKVRVADIFKVDDSDDLFSAGPIDVILNPLMNSYLKRNNLIPEERNIYCGATKHTVDVLTKNGKALILSDAVLDVFTGDEND